MNYLTALSTLSISVLLLLTSSSHAAQTLDVDETTGIKTWKTHAHGVGFSLTQILPDQARAFYVNRGFSLKQIENYSTSCIYMTVLRNDSADGTIHYVSNQWQVFVNGKLHKLVSVDEWVNRLKQRKAKKSALIAFRWAQFPPEQSYEPGGDWNQGMLAIGLPAETKFDIVARWDINGKPYQARLNGVSCAK